MKTLIFSRGVQQTKENEDPSVNTNSDATMLLDANLSSERKYVGSCPKMTSFHDHDDRVQIYIFDYWIKKITN
jgi:hypothetical protein